MATLDTVATRAFGTDFPAGKAYFETSTNKFIVWNGSSWIELHSDGVGAGWINSYSAFLDGTDEYLYFGETEGGTDVVLGTTDLAVSLWFYNSSLNSQDFLFRGGNARAFTDSSNNLLIKGTNYTGSGTITISSLSVNTWYHLVIERTSGTQKTYLDGVLQDTRAATSSFPVSSFGYFTTVGYNWHGGIDEISFHSTGLTQSEVTAIYNGHSPTDLTELYNISGYWRMGDDSTGDKVNDLVGSNDLTVANGADITSSDTP